MNMSICSSPVKASTVVENTLCIHILFLLQGNETISNVFSLLYVKTRLFPERNSILFQCLAAIFLWKKHQRNLLEFMFYRLEQRKEQTFLESHLLSPTNNSTKVWTINKNCPTLSHLLFFFSISSFLLESAKLSLQVSN